MQVISAVPRHRVLHVFKQLSYIPDVYGEDITILRNTQFPFHRVALPADEIISIELLKKYAEDLGFPFRVFLEE